MLCRQQSFSGEETYSLAHMMDILEEQEEDKVFQNKKDAVALVHDWLKPSEDLYGMVDWEKNLCDFQELILQDTGIGGKIWSRRRERRGWVSV